MTKNKLLMTLLLGLPVVALAQGATPGIDARQVRQEQRIDQGVRSGQLTPNEAAKLERGQQHVERLEDKAKDDGVVSAKERRRLGHAQDVQSQRIYREKHDRQTDLNHDGRNDRRQVRRHKGPAAGQMPR